LAYESVKEPDLREIVTAEIKKIVPQTPSGSARI